MADSSPLGLLDTDSLINEEGGAIQQTVRRIVDARIRPYIAEWYENGSTPGHEIAREPGKIGALGVHLEGCGCAGTSTTAHGLACLEVEAGEKIGCFGLTEPDFGSNPADMCTRAKQDVSGENADWVLDGNKMWITNGSIDDVAVVWARLKKTGVDDGIRGFVVPTGTEGFSAPEINQKMSMRASVLTYQGTTEGHQLVIGKALTGQDAFR